MRRKFNPIHSWLAAAAAAVAASTIFLFFPPSLSRHTLCTQHNRLLMIQPVCMITSSFPMLNADTQGQARPKWHMLVL